jgi:maltooligosyltrehalose trehalohydrolase
VKPFGARPVGDGLSEFRVWAPRAESVSLQVTGREVELAGVGDGIREVVAPAAPGDDYWFVLDGERLPDPCSRWQPEGIRGASRIVDTAQAGQPVGLRDRDSLVTYELHVGTFTAEGKFDAAIPYLAGLAELGITAIELMPVAEFPGARGWGYDGVYISAAQSSYGGPYGLARLVAAAHDVGLAVLLDVVYNHIGTSGIKAFDAFGPYFTDRHDTPWGRAINYESEAVREWVLQSATGWIRDFGIDGLRLDAIHSIFDSSDEHIVAAIARRVHAERAEALVVGEIGMDDPHRHGAPACDAIWIDDFHHALHALLTGERDGYYEEFGSIGQLARAFEHTPPQHFVVYSQNHDQVGNRAFGDRLARELQPLAAFCTLLSPFVALLFMGEEYGERAPFQFFSDHIDPEIAVATRVGRREEFATFSQFAHEQIPDPQDPATFERSKLTRVVDPEIAQLYRELVAVRGELPPGPVDKVSWDEDERWLRVRRGRFELLCNFGREAVTLACEAGQRLRLATCEPGQRARLATGETGQRARLATGETGQRARPATGETGQRARPATGETGQRARPATGETGQRARLPTGETGQRARPAPGETGQRVRLATDAPGEAGQRVRLATGEATRLEEVAGDATRLDPARHSLRLAPLSGALIEGQP